jgi:hypothetical protein
MEGTWDPFALWRREDSVSVRKKVPECQGVLAAACMLQGLPGEQLYSLKKLLKPFSSMQLFPKPLPVAVSWCHFPGSLIFLPWGFQRQIF